MTSATPTDFHDAIVLTGPTGCGKTALALELAAAWNAEVIALDSMTVYRGLDIGTAKPTAAEQAAVPHHLIDELDPWQSASVAWWLDRAAAVCRDLRGRGKRPLFVGGTPFYLKALLHGLFDAPPADEPLRARLEAEAVTLGRDRLHARLAEVDPKTAARLHPNDVRRVVRALEVYTLTGRPISDFQQTWDTPGFGGSQPGLRIPVIVLDRTRDDLYDRINSRVSGMMNAGWLDEAKRLLAEPRGLSRESRQAVGYSELFDHLTTGRPLEDAVEAIRTRTRQFAKRQLTWFRGLKSAVRLPIEAGRPVDVDDIQKILAGQNVDLRPEHGG